MVEAKSHRFSVLVKSIDTEEGRFSGILSTYGNVDEVGDVCEAGCFDKSLAEGSRYPLLWQHDSSSPIGSFEATTDDTALRIEGRINMEVARGREAYALLKAGDIDGLSIGYQAEGYDFDRDGIRHLRQVRLLEGSLVTFPANTMARAQAKGLMERRARIMRFAQMKSLDKVDEETRQEILKELESMLEEEKAEKDPADETTPEVTEDQTETEEEKKSEDQTDDDTEDLAEEVRKLKAEMAKIKEKIA